MLSTYVLALFILEAAWNIVFNDVQLECFEGHLRLDPQLKECAKREAVEGLPYQQAASRWWRSGPVILPMPFRAASRILHRLDCVICVCDHSSRIMWLQSKMLAWPHEMLPLRPWFNFSHSASRKRERKNVHPLWGLSWQKFSSRRI